MREPQKPVLYIRFNQSEASPSIDTILLSVTADKLSQREWDWIKLMKPIDPPPAMVAGAILEHRHDTAALARLQDAGD